jgi:group I intron endonuclease
MENQQILQNYKDFKFEDVKEWKGIYCLYNTINDKLYIGQSSKIRSRIIQHLNAKDDLPIHRALKKYGIGNFKIYILEIFKEEDREALNKSEIYFIAKFKSTDSGYNITCGGKGHLGCELSEETRKKLQEIQGRYTIAYNFITKEYVEANSRQELCNKLRNLGYDINVQNIYDAMGDVSYTKDFLVASSIEELQAKIAAFTPPQKTKVFLYNYKTEGPMVNFDDCASAENYIRSQGIQISSGHVSSAVKAGNLYVKDFLIAESESELLKKVESFSPVLYFYNIEKQFIMTFPTAAKGVSTLNDLGFKINTASVGQAKLGHQRCACGFIIGRTKKELISRICNYTHEELSSVSKLVEEYELTDTSDYRDWLDSINKISVQN